MGSRIRSRITYANVISTLALFVALGGTTVAATKISGKDIRKATVTGQQIKPKSVPGNRLRPNTVGPKQVRESSLGLVPKAAHAGTASAAETSVRSESAKVAGTAVSAADAQLLAGASLADLTDACPAGTRDYAGACFESEPRAGTTWRLAARACGDAGRRLPSLAELEGFRHQPGITLAGGTGPEFTTGFGDTNGINSGGEFVVGMYENGATTVGLGLSDTNAKFRCVAPLTNAG